MMATLDSLPQSSPYALERRCVTGAVARRRKEFFAGRSLARVAMQRLSLPPVAIPRNSSGSPKWPSGMIGSITHNKKWVAVAVARRDPVEALGIDLETAGDVTADLRDMIRTYEDCAQLDDTVLFTAKEAVYKAVHPIRGEFLEFSDVSVSLTGSFGGFRAAGNPAIGSSDVIGRGAGRSFEVFGTHVSCFWVPATESAPVKLEICD